jgi:hypothetical protein
MLAVTSGKRKIMTKHSLHQLKNWWTQLGSVPNYCHIYNDGHHLFLGNDVAPGEFIKTPLSFFRYKDGSIDCGDIWIAHRGHMQGYAGGNAFIMVYNSDEIKNLTIPPFHVTYVIMMPDNSLRHMTRLIPLPRSILPLI